MLQKYGQILIICCWFAFPVVLNADEKKPWSQNQQTKIKEALGDLIDEVYRLEDDIVEEMKGAQKEKLYRSVDAVLGKLHSLNRKLDSSVSRQDLYKIFDPLDREVHEILKVGTKAGSGIRPSARRVHFADLELHYAIALGDVSPARKLAVIDRQIEAFLIAAKKLERSAMLALSGGSTVPFQKLSKAAAAMNGRPGTAVTMDAAKKKFVAVDRAWTRMVDVINKLPPRKNTYLLRNAVRLDTLHKRLFELLDMKGKRVVLTIRIAAWMSF